MLLSIDRVCEYGEARKEGGREAPKGSEKETSHRMQRKCERERNEKREIYAKRLIYICNIFLYFLTIVALLLRPNFIVSNFIATTKKANKFHIS